jgi:hypothetical protein
VGGGIPALQEGGRRPTGGPGRPSGSRRGRLRGGAPRRDHRDVGARPRAVPGGGRPCGSGRRGGPGGDAPPLRHRAHGAGARLAGASGAPPGGRGRHARACLARRRPHVRADADRGPGERSGVRPARRRARLAHGPGRLRDRAGRGGPAPDSRWRSAGGPCAARRGRSVDEGRGARPNVHRSCLLRARVRPSGSRAVRRRGGVDRDDGAVVPHERGRQPAWTLPRSPRGDTAAARVVRRGGARGARRVRGAAPLPAAGDGVAADRARADPAPHGRCSALIAQAGTPSPVSPWYAWHREM